MPAFLIALLVALCCVGCPAPPDDDDGDGGEGGGEGEGEGEGEPENAPAAVVPALGGFCGLLDRCPAETFPVASRSRAECIDIVYWLLTCSVDDDDNDVLQLRFAPLELSEAQAVACGATLDALSCDDVVCLANDGCDVDVSACNGLFGRFGNDDDDNDDDVGCGDDVCAAGTFCSPSRYDEVAERTTCAACIPPLAQGDGCEAFGAVPCAAGLSCRSVDDGPDTCQPPASDGEPCLRGDECRSGGCNSLGVCTSDGQLGDACDDNSDCLGFFCDDGVCGVRGDPGAACDVDDDCGGNVCADDGLCGAVDGTACNNGFGCRSLFCNTRDNRCTSLPDEGEACLDFQCDDGLICRDGACRVLCGDEDDCADDEFCDAGECVARSGNGAACFFDEACASGFCNDEVCADEPGLGDPCTAGGCFPFGFCEAGVCVPTVRPGAACTPGSFDECATPFVCQDGRCEAPPLTCAPQPVGEPCAFFRFCEDDAWCDVADGFTCAARVGVGAACTSTGDGDSCTDGLHCDFASLACVDDIAIGGACVDIGGGACVAGAVCVDAVCVEAGAVCDDFDSDASARCGDDRYCAGNSCVPRLTDNDSCRESRECAASLRCAQGACAARLRDGDDCIDDDDCTAASFCDRFGAGCAPRVAFDEICTRSGSGAVGNCSAPFVCSGSTGRCAAANDNGDSCFNGDECASGICDDAVRVCVAELQCVER